MTTREATGSCRRGSSTSVSRRFRAAPCSTMPVISRSTRRKVAVLVIAVVGFVLLYEAGCSTPAAPGCRWRKRRPSRQPAPLRATAYCKGTTTASGVVRAHRCRRRRSRRCCLSAAWSTSRPANEIQRRLHRDGHRPEVQGRELDLYMWSCHEALRFGRKAVQVTVLRLGWDPTASSPSLIDRAVPAARARAAHPPPEAPPQQEWSPRASRRRIPPPIHRLSLQRTRRTAGRRPYGANHAAQGEPIARAR